MSIPNCPKCDSEFAYEDRDMFACPMCQHEWKLSDVNPGENKRVVKDANGNELKDGDSVTLIKTLKVKGSATDIKLGTKVKNIRLIEGDHNIDCKIEGFGGMQLKSEFVKKA